MSRCASREISSTGSRARPLTIRRSTRSRWSARASAKSISSTSAATSAAHSSLIPQARRSATPRAPTATAPEVAAACQAKTRISAVIRLSGWSRPSTNGAREALNGSSPRRAAATEVLVWMRALIAKGSRRGAAGGSGEESCRDVAGTACLRFATARQCMSICSERHDAIRASSLQRSATCEPTRLPGAPAANVSRLTPRQSAS
jgi:hypothetical protein